MMTLFAIVGIVGLLWLFVESVEKSNSVAPSMYTTSGNGWLLVIIAVVGAICVRYLP